jgi:hypothetical protein
MRTDRREAAKWVDGVQAFLCPDPIGAGGQNFCNEGWDVVPDGSLMLTSMATPADSWVRATLVDQAGNYEQLPYPDAPFDPDWDYFRGWAISDDGNTVVGEFGGGGYWGSPPYPVLWNRDLGFTLDLQVFLIGQGLDDLFDWYLEDATAVSADGKIIAGSGVNPDGWIEGWTADFTKVKVCHKPNGNGNGNRRTLTISWDSVADHLGHGDELVTCEFLGSEGHSRAVSSREQAVQRSAEQDSRVGSVGKLNHRMGRVGQGSFGPVTGRKQYPAGAQENVFAPTEIQIENQRNREALRERIRKYRNR